MFPHVKLIDVSKYQSRIQNWSRVRNPSLTDDSNKIDGALIRLMDTDGVTVDPTFEYNWLEAISNGFLVGAYVPFYPVLDAQRTVDTIFKALDKYNRGGWWMGHLPIFIDVEPDEIYKSPEYQWSQMLAFMAEIEKRCLVVPGVYTNANSWNNYINPGNKLKFEKLPPLWVAQHIYDYRLVGRMVTTWDKVLPYVPGFKFAIPNSWDKADIFQIAGDDGYVTGVDTACDMDIFLGTYDQLVSFGAKSKIAETDNVPGENVITLYDNRIQDEAEHELDPFGRFTKYLQEKWSGLWDFRQKERVISNQEIFNAYSFIYGVEYWDRLVTDLGTPMVDLMIANRQGQFTDTDKLPIAVAEYIALSEKENA